MFYIITMTTQQQFSVEADNEDEVRAAVAEAGVEGEIQTIEEAEPEPEDADSGDPDSDEDDDSGDEEVEDDDGEPDEAGEPRISSAALFRELQADPPEGYPKSPMKAIRANCLHCCCGSSNEVARCGCKNCPIWPFRLGRNPYRQKRVLSEAQLESIRKRFAKRPGRKPKE